MTIPTFSIDQALEVWSELWQAYYGDSSYGGDTAQVYAYRLLPHSPTADISPDPGPKEARAREASANLIAMLHAFEKASLAGVVVDGEPFKGELPPQDHRWHIKVVRANPNEANTVAVLHHLSEEVRACARDRVRVCGALNTVAEWANRLEMMRGPSCSIPARDVAKKCLDLAEGIMRDGEA